MKIVAYNKCVLLNDKQIIFLSQKEYDLFVYLIKRKNDTIQRSEILKDVWGLDIASMSDAAIDKNRSVDMLIYKLRHKISMDIVITLPKAYKLNDIYTFFLYENEPMKVYTDGNNLVMYIATALHDTMGELVVYQIDGVVKLMNKEHFYARYSIPE